MSKINFLACDHPETAGHIVEVDFVYRKNFEDNSVIMTYRFVIECSICKHKQVVPMRIENEKAANMLGRIMSRQFDLKKRGFEDG